jgi:multiple sugar transport system substrate-binding protein
MGDSPGIRRSPSPIRAGIPLFGNELPLNLDLSRRDLLKLGGYAGVAAFLAACAQGSTGGGGGATFAKGGRVTVGSNQSDPTPKKAMEDVNVAFTKWNGGTTVKMNTVDHGTFQDQINSYLQATPEDVFTWFSGHRMRFFADKGLVSPMDDVWDKVKSNFSDAFATSAKGNDGHIYGIPIDYYPWAVFYRKSVFQEHGYTVPTNWDAFKNLALQMQKDGLSPIAMGDKDGWPAQGTFDILNLRLNGYDFHVELCTGKQKWTDPRVTKVFQKWAEIAPYYNPGLAGMTWQQAAQLIVQKKAGMYVLGLFVSQQFQSAGQDVLNDLDFFAFPDLGTNYDAEKALDAPIDVMMMSKKSPTLSKDRAQANAYLQFWSKGSTQDIVFKAGGGTLQTANDADTSSYTPLFQKSVQIIKSAKRITQFFDRDSRPDFAGPNGMQSFLLSYLQNPSADTTSLQGKMQQFWDSLPPES